MLVRALAALALLGFLTLTSVVLARFGYLGFFEVAIANAAVAQLFYDLVVCLCLIAFWIYRDARRLGVSPWPFLAVGAAFGIAGPLAYVLRRPREVNPDGRSAGWLPVPAVVASLLLVLLSGFTLYALTRHGYMGIVFYAGANEATQLLFVDVALSTIFLCVLMVRDARSRGAAYVPFLPLALFFGSVGPLVYLVTRALPRGIQRVAGAVSLVAFAFAMTLGSGHADLRTETVRRDEAGSEIRGREMLQRLAERHGLSAWRTHRTMETVGRDVWPLGGPWWPEDDQRFRSQALLGTFTSRVKLLDGRASGEIWGIQAWSPYKKASANAALSFLTEPDGALTFYLPTIQYFNELPFRLLSATVARYAGVVRHRGRSYDLVFATWRSPEPRADLDQYLVWIDRATGLLAKARYTVRDAVPTMPPLQRTLARPLVAGTMHYEDYREIDGVQVPFIQTVTLPPPELTRYPLSENFFHRLTMERAAFDTVAPEELVPDPALGTPADRKPSDD